MQPTNPKTHVPCVPPSVVATQCDSSSQVDVWSPTVHGWPSEMTAGQVPLLAVPATEQELTLHLRNASSHGCPPATHVTAPHAPLPQASGDAQSVSCSDGAPAAPAPSVAPACAEASEFDKRAAAATGAAKEELLCIAHHKHRDCKTAGPTPAPAPGPTETPGVAPAPNCNPTYVTDAPEFAVPATAVE